jgi:pimeloyl-ACP methyl ester carboxylesterase
MIVSHVLNGLAVVAPPLAGRAAFRMFGYAGARAPLRDSEAAVHAEAVTDRLTVNGKRVVAYRWGDGGRPVLLLHGWQSRASRFAGFVRGLRALGHTAISFDAPAHGASGGRFTTAYDYLEAVEQIQRRYGRYDAIIAHSFGAIAAYLAVRTGVRAGRLVTISGAAEFDVLAGAFARQAGLSPRTLAALTGRTERLFGPDGWRQLSGTYRPDQITVPILAVHDDADRVVEVSQSVRVAEAYGARARLLRTTGLGHHRILGDLAVIGTALDFLAEPAGMA